MNKTKLKKLKDLGWVVGDTQEFLGLSDEEYLLVKVKLTLARYLKETRQAQGVSQIDLADSIGSSQSRVSKMEKAQKSVSLDLLFQTLFSLGVTQKEIGKLIAKAVWI